jgi:hypothetical protein
VGAGDRGGGADDVDRPACIFLAIAGAADSVSAVSRSTINQSVTPDAMRGRMSSVFQMVVPLRGRGSGTSRPARSPGCGDPVRFGTVRAHLRRLGGLICAVGVLAIMAVPALAVRADDPVPAPAT